jgi:hypothetical protein
LKFHLRNHSNPTLSSQPASQGISSSSSLIESCLPCHLPLTVTSINTRFRCLQAKLSFVDYNCKLSSLFWRKTHIVENDIPISNILSCLRTWHTFPKPFQSCQSLSCKLRHQNISSIDINSLCNRSACNWTSQWPQTWYHVKPSLSLSISSRLRNNRISLSREWSFYVIFYVIPIRRPTSSSGRQRHSHPIDNLSHRTLSCLKAL